MDNDSASSAALLPTRIAQRYQVIKALGRGGMACVYHVVDEVSGRELALKRLVLPASDEKRNALVGLFEAEFHTLTQLSHPRVIEVYDYGLSDGAPFYTMELLDGGDLHDRSPLPWREACSLIYDVCSSLALLHSRGFVHRDIGPRNVRCTRDGRAKLIDFGTMVPMGRSSMAAGTPAFVAPEVLHRSALDGRADLFSLGATLYFALTRRAAFPARQFRELAELWKRRPAPPSSFDPQIPAALDALALNLLSPDPSMRPRTAFEVMQRLSAIAGLEREESHVSQAYLSTPLLVGRENAVGTLALGIARARAKGGSAYLVRTESGLGRSRILDACVLEAKARGASVLRASSASASSESFALAQTLVEQLLETLGERALQSARSEGLVDELFEAVPEGAQHSASGGERPQLKRLGELARGGTDVLDALQRWLLHASKRQLIVIAVDDVQRCDVASASLLAALAARAERQRLFLALTIEAGAPESASDAMQVLSGYCRELALEALTRAQTEELLSSVFGAVPNLGILTEAVHELARGNPRKCMDLAQHLVDRGLLRYAGGSWTLPEQIDASALPRSAEHAMQERIAGLEPLARWLAQAHALSLFDSLSHADYAALRADVDHEKIDRALLQLLSQQLLVRDGSHYAFARRSWAVLCSATLDAHEQKQRHEALARVYERSAPFAAVHHLLASGQRELGLSRLLALVEAGHDVVELWEKSRMRPVDLVATFERAHQAALELERPAYDRVITAGWLCGLAIITDDSYYFRYVDLWRGRLEHDSGLTIYRELTEISDPNARLMRTLQLLSERYAATPDAERVYPPELAIRLLTSYVGASIAIGARSYNRPLLASLPSMIEPFVMLSPVLDAIRLNALASLDMSCDGRMERSRARWKEVYQKLVEFDASQLPAVLVFRGAVAYAIGYVEAVAGIESAKSWTELLDKDPTQHVNALYLRKVTCLHHGDFEGAERWRKQAELAALQAPTRQMFTNVVVAELWAHAAAGDLVGVKHALERIAPLSSRHPGWRAMHALAEAEFEAIRGDLEAASAAFERCLSLCAPDPRDPGRTILAWPPCVASYVATLLRRGCHEQARSVAREALELCRELEIGISAHPIARGLALAEARLGDFESAWVLLEQVLEQQIDLGIKGLPLGLTYEACTQVAIWRGDQERLQRYARLTASEYRHGRGSALGARYERLMEEARGAGFGALPELMEFASTAVAMTGSVTRDAAMSSVFESMIGASDRRERAQRALRMLCEARNASSGHLYLCVEHGITLAASEGAAEPPPGLREFLERYLRIDQDASESATSVATEADIGAAMRVPSWCDDHSNVHVPLVLTGAVDGAMRPIGVASFVQNEPPRQPIDGRMSSAVAMYLIEAGDVVVAADPNRDERGA